MDNFDELENRRTLIKNISIIGGIVLVSAGLVVFILFQKNPKSASSPDTSNLNTTVSPIPASNPSTVAKPLYSSDLTTWTNYGWPGKINTHYPGDWQLQEDKNSNGIITALEIIPPTNNPTDTIFIGGVSVKCSNSKILQYSRNKCLKNATTQVPFHTNSQNAEVLSAFDTIFQNSILTTVK